MNLPKIVTKSDGNGRRKIRSSVALTLITLVIGVLEVVKILPEPFNHSEAVIIALLVIGAFFIWVNREKGNGT